MARTAKKKTEVVNEVVNEEVKVEVPEKRTSSRRKTAREPLPKRVPTPLLTTKNKYDPDFTDLPDTSDHVLPAALLRKQY